MNEQVVVAIDQLTTNFWLASILYLLAAGIGSFFGGYLLKKAGHLATKEDFTDFRAQLKITTQDTEEIKQKLSSHTWINQQQWSARELYYGKLLSLLHSFDLALNGLSDYYLLPGSEHTPGSKQGEHFRRLKQDAGQAFDDIRKILGPGALYLSEKSVKNLDKMISKHWELIEFGANSTADYVKQAQLLSNSMYKLVLSEAKQQLGIN